VKKKIYIILSALSIICLFSIAALCNQFSLPDQSTGTEEETASEETVADEIEEKAESDEDTGLEDDAEDGQIPGDNGEEEDAEDTSSDGDVKGEAPTIRLEISQGATYSSADDVCFWRVEAFVTGDPAPDISWSKDDSLGAFGDNIAQVNLSSGESYTLTATATNSAGSESAYITLNWECDGESEDETEVVEDVHAYGYSVAAEQSLSGFIIQDTEVVTGTGSVHIGDNIDDMQLKGYLSFDISTLSDITVEYATLTFSNVELIRSPEDIGTILRVKYFAYDTLDLDDFEVGGVTIGDREIVGMSTIIFNVDDSPSFLETLNSAINDPDTDYYQLKFGINGSTNGDGRSDKIVFDVSETILEIIYYQ
jgi:hypothetical protein